MEWESITEVFSDRCFVPLRRMLRVARQLVTKWGATGGKLMLQEVRGTRLAMLLWIFLAMPDGVLSPRSLDRAINDRSR